MEPQLNPGSRPRRGALAVLAVAGVVAAAAGVFVVATPDEARASGLTRFTSCEELSGWAAESQRAVMGTSGSRFETVGEAIEDDMSGGGPFATTTSPAVASETAGAGPGAPDASAGSADGAGTTNVVVDGVDELDLIDRVGDDVVLVTSGSRLVLVDLAAGERLADVAIAPGAQVTYDDASRVAWVVGTPDGATVTVRRISVESADLEEAGEWSTSGVLVDARRVGDRLHLVATEGLSVAPAAVPFAGGPVPCDEVLHPVGPSDPSATLLVSLPVDGPLEPTDATEVVGAGQLVHVTTSAAYLATPLLASEPRVAVHRFELGDLTHTGSGVVDGTLLDDFSISEHDGYLRVAVTHGGRVWLGSPPVAFEGGDPGAVGSPVTGSPVTGSPVTGTPVTGTTMPPEPEPGPGGPVPVDPVPVDPVPVDPTPVDPMPVEPAPMPTRVEPPVQGPASEPLNEVVVLDTDGDLDVVGRSDRFGHPGETIHGVRFSGTTAYAVTFLTTDPFYVLDLADPSAPKVVGEVELPGFSSYLHPLSPSLVVGFGPGADGRPAAKLFDVSDPASPRVADDLVLGDDSPVAYDHHAFVDLGDGRFAVPASTYGPVGDLPDDCAVMGAGPGGSTPEMCRPRWAMSSSVVVVDTSAGRLDEAGRVTVAAAQAAQRVMPVDDRGWALLLGEQLMVVDAGGTIRATVDLT